MVLKDVFNPLLTVKDEISSPEDLFMVLEPEEGT